MFEVFLFDATLCFTLLVGLYFCHELENVPFLGVSGEIFYNLYIFVYKRHNFPQIFADSFKIPAFPWHDLCLKCFYLIQRWDLF